MCVFCGIVLLRAIISLAASVQVWFTETLCRRNYSHLAENERRPLSKKTRHSPVLPRVSRLIPFIAAMRGFIALHGVVIRIVRAQWCRRRDVDLIVVKSGCVDGNSLGNCALAEMRVRCRSDLDKFFRCDISDIPKTP